MKPVWLGFNVSPSDGGSARFCGIRFPLPQATDRMRREGCLQVFKLLQRLGRFLSCYSVSFVVCDYFFCCFLKSLQPLYMLLGFRASCRIQDHTRRFVRLLTNAQISFYISITASQAVF
jgi:hypothetical protein